MYNILVEVLYLIPMYTSIATHFGASNSLGAADGSFRGRKKWTIPTRSFLLPFRARQRRGARNRLRPERINFSQLTRETAGSENKEEGAVRARASEPDFSARVFHLRYSTTSPCRTGVEENFSVSRGFEGKSNGFF